MAKKSEQEQSTQSAAGGGQQSEAAHFGDDVGGRGDREMRRDPTREASGEALRRQMASPTIDSVTTMVCVTCGAEQFFDDVPPAALKCTRCSSSVFRTFQTPTRRDEATIAQLEEQARSVQYGDASPQTAPEEVRDLDMK
jgi:DNA-directed RNA polymerase subunit RPC12/RpoP